MYFTISGSNFGSCPQLSISGSDSFSIDSSSDYEIYGTVAVDSGASSLGFQVTQGSCGQGFYGGGGTPSNEYDVATSLEPFCAVPTNIQQAAPGTASNGVLAFQYSFSSSTGRLADLGSCHYREYVTYNGNPGRYDPNNGDYYPPSPPWSVQPYTNPTTSSAGTVATSGGFSDTQGVAGFAKPYSASSFTATQLYQWNCGCYQGGSWQNFLGQPLQISRTIAQDPGGHWFYQVCKPNIPPAQQTATSSCASQSLPQ